MFVDLNKKIDLKSNIVVNYKDRLEVQFIAKHPYTFMELYIETVLGKHVLTCSNPEMFKNENLMWNFIIDTSIFTPGEDYKGIFTGINEDDEREEVIVFYLTCNRGSHERL